MIRVLVAEDLPTARQLVVEILRSDPEIEIVGQAVDGQDAVEQVRRLRPNLVTMDIMMPRMDGFEATRQIMAENPTPIVIVSSLDVREVTFSMHALRAGALAALPKPRGPGSPGFDEDSRRLLTTVKVMAGVSLLPRPATAEPTAPRPAPPVPLRGSARARVVAVAASTGGPAALQQILSRLSPDFGAAVLVVQHIAMGFSEGFARWLAATSTLKVKVAEHGEALVPGTVYIAPDDRHLGVGPGGSTIALSKDPPIGGFRPSATHLFRSVAEAIGPFGAAVVLTGMGRDGVDGLRAVREAGGLVLAQDRDSSLVYGMPSAVVEEGLADAVVPLAAIPQRLEELD